MAAGPFAEQPTPGPIEVSIVVANWNGLRFLEEGLGSLIQSAAYSGRSWELLVVDDQSQDGSVELIRRRFPEVRLLVNQENLGFARTSNRGAEAAHGRLLLMMNNDMRVPLDFVQVLVEGFELEENQSSRPSVFCIGAKCVQWDDKTPNHLCMRAAWRRGGVGAEWSDPSERVHTTYAQGGSALFRRDLFLRLGGFDPIFAPGYWEDYDLCYRARKAGWIIGYEPRAVADHYGSPSMGAVMTPAVYQEIRERNRLWFTWLNLQDPGLWIRHGLSRPWILYGDWRSGCLGTSLRAHFRALAGVGRVIQTRLRRARTDPPQVLSDRMILREFQPTRHP